MSFMSFGSGFFLGFGTGFLSREVLPFAKEILTPISLITIRATVRVFENSREALSRFGETVEDVVAEVKQDLRKEKQHKKKRVRTKAAPVTSIERTA